MSGAGGVSLLVERPSEVLLRASRHRLTHRIGEGLTSAGIAATDAILLLVSGGSDSMALLVAMSAIRARSDAYPHNFSVISIDHGLREGSSTEAECVAEAARALGVLSVYARRVHVANSGNVLDAAREARYAAATRLSVELGGATLVVAHQAEDRAESFLIALARREGLSACAKLLPRREYPDWAGAEIARPLLDCTREELRGFLRDCGVRWIDDPSNALHRRGALRGEPALRALVAEISGGLSQASEEAAELLALRDALVADALEPGGASCRRESFDALPATARRALLAQIATKSGVAVARAVLVEAAASVSRVTRRFSCSNGAEIVLGRERVEIVRRPGGSLGRATSSIAATNTRL